MVADHRFKLIEAARVVAYEMEPTRRPLSFISAATLFLLFAGSFAPLDSGMTTQTSAVVATIPVGSEPHGVAFDPANGYVYIANFGSDTVSVLDGSSDKIVESVPVGLNPVALAVDSSNGDVYVANGASAYASVIDGATNKVIANVTVGTFAQGIAFDPSNGDIYVTHSPEPHSCPAAGCPPPTVTIVSGSGGAVVGNVTTGPSPWGVVSDQTNGNVYVANFGSNTVSILNGTTNRLSTSVTVGYHPEGVAFDAANGNVYVTNVAGYTMYGSSGTVSVIDGSRVVATIAVGIQPAGIAFDSSNGYVYVANYVSNTTSVIDGSTNLLVAALQVGIAPVGVSFDSSNGQVYVTNSYSDTVSVIGQPAPSGSAPVLPYLLVAAFVVVAIISFVVIRGHAKKVAKEGNASVSLALPPTVLL